MAFVPTLSARLNLRHGLGRSVFVSVTRNPTRTRWHATAHQAASAAAGAAAAGAAAASTTTTTTTIGPNAAAQAETTPGVAHQPTATAPDERPGRARRRAAARARVDAHRALAGGRTPGDALVRVRVPSAQLARASLPAALAQVKVFVPAEALGSDALLRERVCNRVTSLFPEMVQRGMLTNVDDFELAVGNVRLARGNDETLKQAVRRFLDAEGRPGDVFAEMLLNNLPPPPPLMSTRRNTLSKRAADALNERSPLRMVSFYKFVHIERPDIVCSRLLKLWKDMGVLGRVYVATEGVNAQMAVPVPLWSDFEDALSGVWRERNDTLVPEAIVGVFLNCDCDVDRSAAPFEKLHVRTRDKVLADGLDTPLDWAHAGVELSPESWHQMIQRAHAHAGRGIKTKSPDSEPTVAQDTTAQAPATPIILDCRNDYESEVGRFEGSEPLGTSTFRESWKWLENRLDGEARDRPIMTFCTGGIRCNKVNAYLEQKMGFTNTARLSGGIISYARSLKTQGRLHESLFKGVNHVFDGRVGEPITEDALSRCINCGSFTNIQTDCSHVHCPRPFETRLFVQCPECAVRLAGACSPECHSAVTSSRHVSQPESGSVLNGSTNAAAREVPSAKPEYEYMLEAAGHPRSTSTTRLHDVVYANAMSLAEPAILSHLRRDTETRYPGRAHMLCSTMEAALLSMLIKLTGAKRVLEIGTFTGYSALSMAHAFDAADGMIVTCECNEEVAAMAASYFKRDIEHGERIDLRVGDAKDTLLAMQKAREPPFDLVFLDGDKNYEDYYGLLINGGLLRVGGLLVVDNVLFGGHVSQIWAQNSSVNCADVVEALPVASTDSLVEGEFARKRLKSLANARKIAGKIEAFNKRVALDPAVELVLLPVRDGISLVRRRI